MMRIPLAMGSPSSFVLRLDYKKQFRPSGKARLRYLGQYRQALLINLIQPSHRMAFADFCFTHIGIYERLASFLMVSSGTFPDARILAESPGLNQIQNRVRRSVWPKQ